METKKNPIAELLECIPANVSQLLAHVDDEMRAYGLPGYSELIRDRIYHQDEASRKDENLRHARESCECTAEGISEMVRAFECDYDRLEELRDERQALIDECIDALAELDEVCTNPETVQGAYTEACERLTDAETELTEWQAEYADELAELLHAAGEFEDQDEARTRIEEDPLEITLSASWSIGTSTDDIEADEFTILLTTGGPAVRIHGELDGNNQPRRAWLEYQDWFTPWTEYHGDAVSMDDLLTYCQVFYFGD